MTTKELKDMISMLPDDFEVGYTKTYEVFENYYGSTTTSQFWNDIHLNVDLQKKQVSLLEIKSR